MQTLVQLNSVFAAGDPLLRSQSSVPVFYLTMQAAERANKTKRFSRNKIAQFNEKLSENRTLAELDIAKANFDFLEFDRMSQQGTNDANSITERVKILARFLGFPSDLS